MISIPIAGANISDKRMNKLSSDKSPQDIMSLRNKVTDFFRHGEINNALTLIHNVYYKKDSSILDRLTSLSKLIEMTGENYKFYFNANFENDNIMFSIDNEVKLEFNLRDIIFDIVNNKETIAENRPLEKNNAWIDSIIENINKNNIINNNEDFISIIEKIKIECLFTITENLNKNKSLTINDFELSKFLFKENNDIYIKKLISNIFLDDNKKRTSIVEKIKDFNLLKSIIKESYNQYISLEIKGEIVELKLANIIKEYNLINLIKEQLPLVIFNKNKTLLDQFERYEISKKIKKNLIYKLSYRKNISILDLMKDEIRETLLSYGVKDIFLDLNLKPQNINELIKLFDKLEYIIPSKIYISFNDNSIKLFIKNKDRKKIKITELKTSTNPVFLNKIELPNYNKLIILSEIEKKSNRENSPINIKLIKKFLLYNIDYKDTNNNIDYKDTNNNIDNINANIYRKYHNTLIDDFNFLYYGIHNIFSDNQREQYILRMLFDNKSVDNEDKMNLRYLYFIINNKKNKYYNELINLNEALTFLKKSMPKIKVDEGFFDLFLNKKNTLLQKISIFRIFKNWLKNNANTPHNPLDFIVKNNKIEFYLVDESGKKKISTEHYLNSDVYHKISELDKDTQIWLLEISLMNKVNIDLVIDIFENIKLKLFGNQFSHNIDYNNCIFNLILEDLDNLKPKDYYLDEVKKFINNKLGDINLVVQNRMPSLIDNLSTFNPDKKEGVNILHS
ncbi:hypothetical protein AB7107_01410 [Proteus terrae]|uniref:hypothetical protein n=2 Tax=Proteus terrae TaxID=1574161 RepID=UPI0034E41AE3